MASNYLRGARARRYEKLLVSMGVAAYLTLCPDVPPGDAAGAAHLQSRWEGATLCAGYRGEKKWGEPLKLLRRPSVAQAPALFTLVPEKEAEMRKLW